MQTAKVILIVGAGPTGMSIALELTRFGVPVRLIDKCSEPPTTSRAIAVQARTLEYMQQRGLANEMLRIGNKGIAISFHSNGKELGQVDLRGLDSRFNYMQLLPQSDTERILRESLERSGVRVERQTEMIAFSEGEDKSAGVQATLRKPDGSLEEVDAAYLIDAEGAHSVVRHSMDLSFEGNSLPHSYALADLYLDGDLLEDQLYIFTAQTGLLAAFPLGNHRFRIIAAENDAVEKNAPPPDVAHIQQLWDIGAHRPVHFHNMVWSSRFRINSRAVKQLRHGRVFFGGDSAHVHSPAGGQGMNTGIQDMMNLGWKLALVYKGIAAETLLDTYNEERIPIIQKLLSNTERATDTFNSDSPLVHTLIDYSMPFAFSFDSIRSKGAGIVSEFSSHYRKSSLTGSVQGSGKIQAGDRLPDIALEDMSDTRVLDILDPSVFTFLLLDSSVDEAAIHSVVDPRFCQLRKIGKVSRALSEAVGGAAVVVVRPDGYVMSAGSFEHIAHEFRSWVTKWLPAL